MVASMYRNFMMQPAREDNHLTFLWCDRVTCLTDMVFVLCVSKHQRTTILTRTYAVCPTPSIRPVRMTTCGLTLFVYQSPRTRYLILYGSISSVFVGSCCKRHQRCKLYSCITQHTKGLVSVMHRPLSHQTFRRCVSSLQTITSFSDILFQDFIQVFYIRQSFRMDRKLLIKRYHHRVISQKRIGVTIRVF